MSTPITFYAPKTSGRRKQTATAANPAEVRAALLKAGPSIGGDADDGQPAAAAPSPRKNWLPGGSSPTAAPSPTRNWLPGGDFNARQAAISGNATRARVAGEARSAAAVASGATPQQAYAIRQQQKADSLNNDMEPLGADYNQDQADRTTARSAFNQMLPGQVEQQTVANDETRAKVERLRRMLPGEVNLQGAQVAGVNATTAETAAKMERIKRMLPGDVERQTQETGEISDRRAAISKMLPGQVSKQETQNESIRIDNEAKKRGYVSPQDHQKTVGSLQQQIQRLQQQLSQQTQRTQEIVTKQPEAAAAQQTIADKQVEAAKAAAAAAPPQQQTANPNPGNPISPANLSVAPSGAAPAPGQQSSATSLNPGIYGGAGLKTNPLRTPASANTADLKVGAYYVDKKGAIARWTGNGWAN